LTTITGRRRRRARAVSVGHNEFADPATRGRKRHRTTEPSRSLCPAWPGTGHQITRRESYPRLVAEKGARSTLGDTPDGKTITTISLAMPAGGDHPQRTRCRGVPPDGDHAPSRRVRASLPY